jgi:excinuclease ABC subunit A
VQPAGRPEVDAVYGIPPTVAIEQRLSRGGRKSTVGTTTEVWHFLRLLYVKFGTQHCIHDGAAVQPQSRPTALQPSCSNSSVASTSVCWPRWSAAAKACTPSWPNGRAHAALRHLRVDGNFVPTTNFPRIDRFKEHNIELPVISLDVDPANEGALRAALATALTHGKGVVHVMSALHSLREAMAAGTPTAGIGTVQVYSTQRACPVCATSYAELDPRLFSYNSKHGWCPDCVGTGVALTKEQRKVFDDSVKDDDTQGREQTFAEADVEDLHDATCPTCQGTRLNATARAVRFAMHSGAAHAHPAGANGQFHGQFDAKLSGPRHGWSITDIARLSVGDVRQWVQGLLVAGGLTGREADIARDLLPEIQARLEFLEEVGLGYLTLDRGAPTLSGGEAQRIRLAAQLGSNLQGVCYVLDEPTIGLHARDNQMLLKRLAPPERPRATRCWWWSTTRTPFAMPTTSSTLAPARASAVGGWWRRARWPMCRRLADSQTGRYLAHAMRHPLAARRFTVAYAQSLELDAAVAAGLSVDTATGYASSLAAAGAGAPGASYIRFATAKSAPGAPTPAFGPGGREAGKMPSKARPPKRRRLLPPMQPPVWPSTQSL